MSRISIHNYEMYFLDFAEGQLDEQLVQELNQFLEAHPELKKELADFENITLATEENTEYLNKEILRKDPETLLAEMDMILIGNLEKELSQQQKEELQELLQKPFAQKEAEFYQKTILCANLGVQFENKGKLKRRKNYGFYKYSAAAALLAILFLWFTYSKEEIQPAVMKVAEKVKPKQDSIHSKPEEASEIQEEKSKLLATQHPKAVSPSTNGTTAIFAVKKNLMVKLEMQPPKQFKNRFLPEPEAIALLPQIHFFTPTTDVQQEALAENSRKNSQNIAQFLAAKVNTELLNNQVNIKNSKEGRSQQLAIEIGNFSFSHSKN